MSALGGIPSCTEADTRPVNRMTNSSKNITLATTSLRPVNMMIVFMSKVPSWKTSLVHPEGTSIGSDICDFLKVSDFNGSL